MNQEYALGASSSSSDPEANDKAPYVVRRK